MAATTTTTMTKPGLRDDCSSSKKEDSMKTNEAAP